MEQLLTRWRTPGATRVPRGGFGARIRAHSRVSSIFKLGDRSIGIDILRVQEIRSYEDPRALPTLRRSSKVSSTCAA